MTARANAPDLRALEDSYEILGELRARTDARQFLAKRREDGDDVMITVYEAANGGENNALAHLASDVNQLTGLRHPGLLPTLDGRWLGNDAFAVITQRVPGRSVDELLSSGERLTNPRIASILQQVRGIVDWARDNGIVHRGVTVDTLYIERDTNALCASLALTPIPMEGLPDECSDAQMIGSLAWTLLTGKPYDGEESQHRLSDMRPDLSARLVAETEAMARCRIDGERPDLDTMIAVIATGDAWRASESSISQLEAEHAEQMRLAREEFEAEKLKIQQQLADETDRLAAERAEYERATAEERAAYEQATATERAEYERRTQEEREEFRRSAAAERAEADRRLAEERAAFDRQMREQREAFERQASEQHAELTELRDALEARRAEIERLEAEVRSKHAELTATLAEMENRRIEIEQYLYEEQQRLDDERDRLVADGGREAPEARTERAVPVLEPVPAVTPLAAMDPIAPLPPIPELPPLDIPAPTMAAEDAAHGERVVDSRRVVRERYGDAAEEADNGDVSAIIPAGAADATEPNGTTSPSSGERAGRAWTKPAGIAGAIVVLILIIFGISRATHHAPAAANVASAAHVQPAPNAAVTATAGGTVAPPLVNPRPDSASGAAGAATGASVPVPSQPATPSAGDSAASSHTAAHTDHSTHDGARDAGQSPSHVTRGAAGEPDAVYGPPITASPRSAAAPRQDTVRHVDTVTVPRQTPPAAFARPDSTLRPQPPVVTRPDSLIRPRPDTSVRPDTSLRSARPTAL